MYWTADISALWRIRLGLACLAAASMSASAGCSGRTLQADNPVLASAPPRVRLEVSGRSEELTEAQSQAGGSDIEQASFSDASDPNSLINQDISGVAATVNGMPILVADVVERFTPQLKAAEKQLSREEYDKLKQQLIQRELPAHIEQAILVDYALSQLNGEQRGMVEEQLEKFFSQELAGMQAETGAGSLAELEAILQQHGTSITNMQRSFNNRTLAQQAMGMLAPQEPMVSRAELLEEYQSRLDEFTEPERVKWQQIWISYKKHGGKQEAFFVLDEVVTALRQGALFDDVARKYSDGVMAADGGHWDWTERGSLTSEDVEQLVFDLPVGEIGQVIEGENAFQLVRVTERKPQTTKTFAELQLQLSQEIKRRKQQEMLEDIVAELKDGAIISTMIDAEQPGDE